MANPEHLKIPFIMGKISITQNILISILVLFLSQKASSMKGNPVELDADVLAEILKKAL